MGVRELPEQAGLPDAGLADDRDDLPATAPGEIERLRELRDLTRPADELGEPARGVRAEASTASLRPFTGIGPSDFT